MKSEFNIIKKGPPSICVEMSGNHKGNLDSALEFLKLAKFYGADYLKLQVYTPDTITLKSNLPDFRVQAENEWSEYSTLHELYSKAFTPWDWIKKLFEESKKIGITTFASPFDLSAVEFLEKLDCPAYKIASPEITDHNLIRECAKTGKPVILSTGLSSLNDLDQAVSILKANNAEFVILKCVSAYPANLADMNITTISYLKDKYKCNVGLSDHTLGSEAAFAATALGATLIEKHFKIPGDNFSVDSSFSMELSELPNFKKSIHSIYTSLGTPTLDLPSAAKVSFSGRRSIYVVKKLIKGEEFTHENIRSIRPCYGLHPKYLNSIIGKKASKDIEPGTRMDWSLVEDK
ncbi:pseudaminic acid synthase [Prochlorococcus sp. AH-736-E02]|nr:pseudaminic acid synthase [Prochlorococcus sp. AH-736-E02]